MPQYHRQKGPLLVQGNLFVTGTVTPSYTPVGGMMVEADAESTSEPMGPKMGVGVAQTEEEKEVAATKAKEELTPSEKVVAKAQAHKPAHKK